MRGFVDGSEVSLRLLDVVVKLNMIPLQLMLALLVKPRTFIHRNPHVDRSDSNRL